MSATVAEHCEAVRVHASCVRTHLEALRAMVSDSDLFEAQQHLLGLTAEVNRAEERFRTAGVPCPLDGKRMAAGDFEPAAEPTLIS